VRLLVAQNPFLKDVFAQKIRKIAEASTEDQFPPAGMPEV